MDIQRTFNLGQLPVSFGGKLVKLHDGITAKAPVDSAVRNIVGIISQQAGFRFIHHDTRALVYRYYCSQDKAKERASNQKHRDRQRTMRFDCQSNLQIPLCLDSRTLFLSMYHKHHTEYFNKELSIEVMEFLTERIESMPPAEIFRDLQAAKVPGWDKVTRSQVYYRYNYF